MKTKSLPGFVAAASIALVGSVALVLLCATANSATLWDQSNVDEFGAGFFNSVSGGPPFGMTAFTVSDVAVPASGWEIQSVTMYFSSIDPNWGAAITQGRLNIFPKSGALPVAGDNPSTGTLVAMSSTSFGSYISVTASGLSIPMLPGDYWVGITPIAPSGPFGPEIGLSSLTPLADASPSWDLYAFPPPSVWFNMSPGADAAILLEGLPGLPATPAKNPSWGAIKSRYR